MVVLGVGLPSFCMSPLMGTSFSPGLISLDELRAGEISTCGMEADNVVEFCALIVRNA